MTDIIDWCNENNGFLTAILSLLSLLLSGIAISVSIKTALLPYRKKLKLGASYNIGVSKDLITSQISSQTIGMSITAVNIGSRDINLSFLGLAVKDKSFDNNIRKMEGLLSDIGGKGIVHPTELGEARYDSNDLIKVLSHIPKAKVYICAMDTEGKTYRRRLWNAQDIIDHLKV